ncbi:MAG: DMT family transporter [Nitriliruptoraceae bacterium]
MTAATPPDQMNARQFGILVLLALMWGMSFLFIEVAVGAVAPIWVVATRTATGSVVLYTIVRLRGRRLPRDLATWCHLGVLGLVNNAIPWTAIAFAQQSLPSGLAALLMAFVPTSTLVLSVLIGAERLSARRIVSLTTAFAGVAIIVVEDLTDMSRLTAILALIGATLMYATAAVYAKHFLSGNQRPLVIATGQVLCTAVMTIPAGLVFAPLPPAAAWTVPVVGSIMVLGVVSTGLAYLLFYILIEGTGATNASMVTYLIPVVAVISGAIVLGERLGLSAIAGGALVVAGIALSQRTPPASAVEQIEYEPR